MLLEAYSEIGIGETASSEYAVVEHSCTREIKTNEVRAIIENQQQLDVPNLVLEAVERCQDYLSPTPLEYSMYLSEQVEGEVWLKLDSM